MQPLDAHTKPLDGHQKPLDGHQKAANGDFGKLRRKLLYAAGRIEARYVKNCGMLREELRHAVRKIAVCYVKNFCTLCGRIAVRNVKNCSTLCGDCGMLRGRLLYAAEEIAARCGEDCSVLHEPLQHAAQKEVPK